MVVYYIIHGCIESLIDRDIESCMCRAIKSRVYPGPYRFDLGGHIECGVHNYISTR